MQNDNPSRSAPKRIPWNKGKLTGARPPLRPKNVWSIRTKLQVEGRIRDLAMFNFAIDRGHRHLARVNRQREELDVQGKAAAFVRWHEPYESRGSRTVLRGARGEIPRAYSANLVIQLGQPHVRSSVESGSPDMLSPCRRSAKGDMAASFSHV